MEGVAPTSLQQAVDEAVSALNAMEHTTNGRTGLESFDALNDAELALAQLKLAPFLEQTTSYLSVLELGLYSGSGQLYRSLQEKGIASDTPEWKEQVEAYLVQARKTMEGRLRPDIPARRYVCFYPMDKKRGEEKNWYDAPFAERQRMMQDHGFIGRGYAGRVTQIISGSIGFDDGGVGLRFANPTYIGVGRTFGLGLLSEGPFGDRGRGGPHLQIAAQNSMPISFALARSKIRLARAMSATPCPALFLNRVIWSGLVRPGIRAVRRSLRSPT